MWKCCEQHVELAIDMYVDEKQQAPEISTISVDKKEEICDFCEQRAVYIVGN
ncbi:MULTISPECIES: CxxH/CxxC protein [Anoxybacillus]|uniref:CxxH/CxxC protein n=2 Tax=Anoxybacillus TaxID=150247 RepID=A0A178TD03_9BACL|nr:CxxH/CxxC protein [Anoxybacillus flavithermus]MBB6176241.1 CxxH/CxxC protein (TIGR04129 family) [Anoxybacillus tengchongensis]ASA97170.1 CxxH/CxxC protein [Anoxybacillus flavithermus]ELK20583.1 hypothetical protein AF6_2730 [Anoxybacillus flavithermus TNO-09.006]MBE2904912.1 CxxH/CxxC protein [Anoxybacillus flavithermus]MBE2907705.1 CxxH/CxxC protein [Anoxybacillus flavithermus]